MKHITGIITLAFAIFCLQLSASAAESLKIGILDLQRCMQESNEGKRLVETLNKKKAEMEKEINTKRQELIDMNQDLEKQSLMMKDDAKLDRRQEIEKKSRDFGYLVEDKENELKKSQAIAQNGLLKLIIGVVDTIAKNEKYDLITERSATLYFTKSLDITDKVIAELNKEKQ